MTSTNHTFGDQNRKPKSADQLWEGEGDELEYIEEARAKRAAKDVIKGKENRGRKRMSAALEVDEPEPEVARMIRCASAMEGTAPVAQMI
jgi:hypothetical protein